MKKFVSRCWPPNIHAFALSQRGHRDSSRPASGYRFEDMSAERA